MARRKTGEFEAILSAAGNQNEVQQSVWSTQSINR